MPMLRALLSRSELLKPDGDADLFADRIAIVLLGVDDEEDEVLALAQTLLDLHDDLAARELAGGEVGSIRLDLLRGIHDVALRVVLVAAEHLDREALLRGIASEIPDPELHRPRLVLLDGAGLDAPRGEGELGVGDGVPDAREEREGQEASSRREPRPSPVLDPHGPLLPSLAFG